MNMYHLLLFTYIGCVYSYDPPVFVNGRPHGGLLREPYVEHPELLRNAEDKWFVQKLNHFNDNDNRIWKQRYFVNTENFINKQNGPVFLMVGGEGTLSSRWLSVGAMSDYAKEHGALMFALEHRFYGKSHPLNDTTVSSLRYLSSEQALADLATFRQAMAKQFKLSEDNRWIIFGGSYPGALSAWFRYKYPHLAYGAVASSAPIHAQLDFPAYLEVASAVLDNQCQQNVGLATMIVEKSLETSVGLDYLSNKFHTCGNLTTNEYDQMQFASTLAGNFFGVIQYNKDNKAWEGAKGTNITIDTLCGIMNNEEIGSVLDRYAAVNSMMMKVYGTKCFDVDYGKFVKFMRATGWDSSNAEGARQWIYQTCTEFGYYQTTDTPYQVYGTKIPLKFFLKQCVDIYGKSFNETNNRRGINWTNANYGGYALAKSASRIIFPNGSIDPWHALSLLKSVGDIVAEYITGTAHCANMYPPAATDSEGLMEARYRIGNRIGTWLSRSN